MKKVAYTTSTFLFTTLFFACNAFGEDKQEKNFQIKSEVRLENFSVDTYQATNSNDETKENRATARLRSDIVIYKNWFSFVDFRFQEVGQNREENKVSISGKDRNYEDEGAFIRELRLGYRNDNFELFAGKFRAYFGEAWRKGRGIWTQDIAAANYMQIDKMGISSTVSAGDIKTIGRYDLTLSLFTNERKNFDNSIITKRDNPSKSDALPGDTRNLNSYTANLDVNYNFGNEETLYYRFAYTNLAVNSLAVTAISNNKVADQKGYSASIEYKYPFTNNFRLDTFLEYVHMKNVGGNSDITQNFNNAVLVGNFFKKWNLTLAYVDHKNRQIDFNGYDQYFAESSAGYTFEKNNIWDSLLLQVGYKNLRTNYKTSLDVQNSYGVLVRLFKNF